LFHKVVNVRYSGMGMGGNGNVCVGK